MSDTRGHSIEIGTGESYHARDWVCIDCGIVYCADEDAVQHDLPEFCPECGDNWGWENRKTGREI